jgi:ABC-type phosphate transport system substrate-binding protein
MLFKSAAATFLGALVPLAYGQQEIPTIHGSGTTNPSKCIWRVMSLINERALDTTRLTYRAVGSGTGIHEFVGEANTPAYKPYDQHFGAGDIPVPQDDYNNIKSINSDEVFHLPFVVSGISFFHNVAVTGAEDDKGLKLTPCILAGIFNGKIKTWDHQDIKDQNPGISIKSDYKITVAHRWEGSSSTKSITQYLNKVCPSEWPDGKVDKEAKNISWPENAVGNSDCDSSGKMADCISNTDGTIGYLDSGHGWESDLNEIELQNKDGVFLSSKTSFDKDGMSNAADVAIIAQGITDFKEDFSAVNLINLAGEDTWPIMVMSYIYVRKNMANLFNDQRSEYLLKIFLQALYHEDYIGECATFHFSPVPTSVKNKALVAIGEVAWADETSETKNYKFEVDIEKGAGMESHVLSKRRRAYGEYERGAIEDKLEDLTARSDFLFDYFERLEMADLENLIKIAQDEKLLERTEKISNRRITASLVLASISFAFWCAAILFFIVKKVANV